MEGLESRTMLAISAELVADINIESADSNPSGFVQMGEAVFFVATSPEVGSELWRTDGTEEGTVLVKDIRPGAQGSNASNLTNVDGILYFAADDGVSGVELWRSDGTEVGTVLVSDINPGSDGSDPANLTKVDGIFYFTADDGVSGTELWSSDGTESGTGLVLDIRPGSDSSSPRNLADFDGRLYFRANDGALGNELWTSDGTASGTELVLDIRPGSSSSSPGNLTTMGDTLYFTANNGVVGTELWSSDGTPGGTELVLDIRPGSSSASPRYLTVAGDTLYFSAFDGSNGRELWKSDGTAGGTSMVQDINPGSSSSSPSNLTVVGDDLYFSANDGVLGTELWRSNVAAGGADLVADLNPGASSSSPSSLTVVGDTLYFSADDGLLGTELWRSDGSASGTALVADLNPGSDSSSPSNLTQVNGWILFSAVDAIAGRELWKSDGSASGTSLVKQINTGTKSSYPEVMVDVNGTVFFSASQPETYYALWKSDGTPEGTVLVKDIMPGPYVSGERTPNHLTNIGGTLYFVADDGVHGLELWRSDGTAEGTVMVKDINPGPGSSIDYTFSYMTGGFVAVGDVFFFGADDGVHGVELWKSDGTEVGTVMVKDIDTSPESGDSQIRHWSMIDFGGTLLFAANDGVNGRELWRSDGTEEGTLMVKDIYPGNADDVPNNGSPHLFYSVGGVILFYATEDVHGCELWRSDGTEEGTYLVEDINPGPGNGVSVSFWISPPDFPAAVIDDQLYFQADDGNLGYELWKSDGTPEGTVLVKDIKPGPGNGFNPVYTGGPLYAASFVNADGMLYFRADDGTHGVELWKSDGTTEGTALVHDINPGDSSSLFAFDFPMVSVGEHVYFRADDGVHGGELWRSDGTEAGTILVRDIYPDAGSSLAQATWLTNVQGTLFFSADDPIYGRELWKVVEIVQLDVKPDGDPNSLNLKSNGNVPVAVLSTPDFDATTIDTSDLSRLRFGDVRLTTFVSPERAKLEDVDGDGDVDLLLFFSTRKIREQGALVGDSTMAQLTGFTQTGQFISGTDSVRIVPGSSSGKPMSAPASDSQPAPATAVKEKELTQGQVRRIETGPPESVIDKKAADAALMEEMDEEDIASVICADLDILDLLAPNWEPLRR